MFLYPPAITNRANSAAPEGAFYSILRRIPYSLVQCNLTPRKGHQFIPCLHRRLVSLYCLDASMFYSVTLLICIPLSCLYLQAMLMLAHQHQFPHWSTGLLLSTGTHGRWLGSCTSSSCQGNRTNQFTS